MCGIAGYFGFGNESAPPSLDELVRMGTSMARRGPDGEGIFISPDSPTGFVHRRLSIIDLSVAADQPMHDPRTGNTIVYNGEIYNYNELRDDLIAAGETFTTSGDTEVLLALYRTRGPAMVDVLRGMFALAIHDRRHDRLFLARDTFGIKPLYYAVEEGRGLRFASQVKALVAGGAMALTPDPSGNAGFFIFGHVPEPFTIWREIRALPAGAAWTVERDGRIDRGSGTTLPDLFADTPAITAAPGSAREMFGAALLDSVRYHYVADVPVGLFLSAGLDSASLLALSASLGQSRPDGGDGAPLRTVTLGFTEFAGTEQDEVAPAARIARHYRAAHVAEMIARDDFTANLGRILAAMDQPSIDGVNTWFVSRAAHRAGLKVALSGLGGDEMLGGYSDFHTLPRLRKWLAIPSRVPGLAAAFAAGARRTTAIRQRPKIPGLLYHGRDLASVYLLSRSLALPMELECFVDPAVAREGLEGLRLPASLRPDPRLPEDEQQAISLLLATNYMRSQLLRDSDWASMDNSLEVRVPLVDVPLWETVIGLRKGGHRFTKTGMATSMAQPLPTDFVSRPKTGFAVPVPQWLRETGEDSGEVGLRGWARTIQREFAA